MALLVVFFFLYFCCLVVMCSSVEFLVLNEHSVSSILVAQMETLCGTTIEGLLQEELRKTGNKGTRITVYSMSYRVVGVI